MPAWRGLSNHFALLVLLGLLRQEDAGLAKGRGRLKVVGVLADEAGVNLA